MSELAKHQANLKEDMAALIQNSIKSLQSSVDALHETVNAFQSRLTLTEVLEGENFEQLASAEVTIKTLQIQNASLLDRL